MGLPRCDLQDLDAACVGASYVQMTLQAEPLIGQGPPPRSRWFLVGYGAAQAGAFIAFIPLLTLLLPMQAEVIAGADKALLLSQVAMIGGVAAAFANIAFGALSDRGSGRFGRRRPWIMAGLAASAAALGLIGAATTATALMLAVVAFQFAINALYAPLTAVVPDMVPNRQKGAVVALASLALPIANVFTAVVVVALAASLRAQILAVIAAASVLIVPFALQLREPAVTVARDKRWRLSLAAFRDMKFALAFLSRLLTESGVAINTLFLLFLIQGQTAGPRPWAWSDLELFSALLLVSTITSTLGGLSAGLLSDRAGRRAPFVITGGVGMAIALVLLACSSDWSSLLIAQTVFGLAHGVHAGSVSAMNAEILPDPAHAGRDLGLMNLAIALPQGLAPALAATVLAAGLPLARVFGSAGVGVLVAAAFLIPLARKV